MSLDKAIEHGKEHRKPYRGSKAIDPSCRNHGGCQWCEENRKHKFRDKENGCLVRQNQTWGQLHQNLWGCAQGVGTRFLMTQINPVCSQI